MTNYNEVGKTGSTVSEVCEALGWDRKTLRRHTKAGRMPRPQWIYDGRVRKLLYPPGTIEQGWQVKARMTAGAHVDLSDIVFDDPDGGYEGSRAHQVFVDWILPSTTVPAGTPTPPAAIDAFRNEVTSALELLPITDKAKAAILRDATKVDCCGEAIHLLLRGYAPVLVHDGHDTRVIAEVLLGFVLSQGRITSTGMDFGGIVVLPLIGILHNVWQNAPATCGDFPKVRLVQPAVVWERLNDDTVLEYDFYVKHNLGESHRVYFDTPFVVRDMPSVRAIPVARRTLDPNQPPPSREPMRRGRPQGKKDSTPRKPRASKGSSDAR